MDHFEAAVNEVSDKDWSWWPFLWLRPEKEAHLSFGRMMAISLLYGVPASTVLALGIRLQYAETLPELIGTSLFFPLLLLFVSTVIVAPMWNRRAERLRARQASGFGT